MNIIFPIGGKGERFFKEGYTKPKPLIPILEKTMIETVIDNIFFNPEDRVFIIYQKDLDDFGFRDLIESKYPRIHLIKMDQHTKGAVETLAIGIQEIIKSCNHHKKTILLDCDTFYTQDVCSIFREAQDNMVFYTKNMNPSPIYSYIELDQDDCIQNIAEKRKISDNANTGAYAFADIYQLHELCNYALENNITFNNEPYTSCVISVFLDRGFKFKGHELEAAKVFSLGTPRELTNYMEKTHAFFFDLDGTLVISDEIYLDVWKNIVKDYHIEMTMDIFKRYIQGNSDKYVMDTLLSNINIDSKEISRLKDDGFIENISKIEIIDGTIDFLKRIKEKGHKCCIVTNCNKRVAEKIVDFIGINDYIDFIISADDCVNGKPSPEPYQKAIARYNIPNNKCIIFEDSKTGLLSGKSVHPKRLIGLETLYKSEEMKQYGVDFSIKDYQGFTVDSLLENSENLGPNIEDLILNNMNIDELIIDKAKYKGGFIADVIGFKVVKDGQTSDYVVKFENENPNSLSDMANRLQLYQREYYLYENLSTVLPLKIPKYISVLKDENGYKKGIVLENMLVRNGFKLNLNLNTENIDISLKIIDAMARMHAKFWDKNIKAKYPDLKTTDDPIFRPFLQEFIDSRMETFKEKWKNTLSVQDMAAYESMKTQFSNVQHRLSDKNTTLLHGDIKSPNIFYDRKNGDEPYFLDWQHCCIGKGVQDLAFFIIESFDMLHMKLLFPIFKNYYYKKLIEYGVLNYSFDQYTLDLKDAIGYVPFFTAIWFGSTPNDELIDKNFPYFFIKKHLSVFHIADNK
jgi:HAD superfamily hydrolase (TIGR01509 family)